MSITAVCCALVSERLLSAGMWRISQRYFGFVSFVPSGMNQRRVWLGGVRAVIFLTVHTKALCLCDCWVALMSFFNSETACCVTVLHWICNSHLTAPVGHSANNLDQRNKLNWIKGSISVSGERIGSSSSFHGSFFLFSGADNNYLLGPVMVCWHPECSRSIRGQESEDGVNVWGRMGSCSSLRRLRSPTSIRLYRTLHIPDS